MSVCDVMHMCMNGVCVHMSVCVHTHVNMCLCMSVYMYVGSHGVQMHKTLELQAGHHACLVFMWVLGI